VVSGCSRGRADASSGSGGLTIKTEDSTLDEHYCAANVGAVPGDYVRLTEIDTGCGMDKDTLSHLFEPFSTTKVVGEGTGLGLATVCGIVWQIHGIVNVYCEPNLGTTFTSTCRVRKANPRTDGRASPPKSATPWTVKTDGTRV
jgi:signal transduction histidine kinase